MKKSTKKIDYTANYTLLQEQIAAIENENISLDELAEKVKSALKLVETCEQALRIIENDLPKA